MRIERAPDGNFRLAGPRGRSRDLELHQPLPIYNGLVRCFAVQLSHRRMNLDYVSDSEQLLCHQGHHHRHHHRHHDPRLHHHAQNLLCLFM